MGVTLTAPERALLDGEGGDATALAMRVVVAAADLLGAERLVEIASAHVDGCLYHGDGGVEFAERLVAGGGRVRVPTTLNVGALDLLHPDRVRGGAHHAAMARRQMEAYLALGCEPTWTCAPYQAGHRPRFGEQVAWGESNAVAFANSVLGARTERYGDFLDACCALTGRAPLYGLHLAANRVATVVVDASGVPDALKHRDVFYPVLGTWLGLEVGRDVAAIAGLPADVTEDQLKALGAAGASSGSVSLFHVVGVTPEAPTLTAATGGRGDARRIELSAERLRPALDRLSTTASDAVDAVAVGSPHFSPDEFRTLVELVRGRRLRVPFYACTGRGVLAQLEASGDAALLAEAGVRIVVDTCVVVTPILPAAGGVLMTCSGKFAHYGPSNTGYEVVYGSLEDCVASAVAGRVVRDEAVWSW
ncbi:MAG TPA: aconitase X catalytic domain-containing protein [Longimicrobiales bacterium]|nr:aconitase X catalytic domain-containing protein [Longimicrobiales bacterium]